MTMTAVISDFALWVKLHIIFNRRVQAIVFAFCLGMLTSAVMFRALGRAEIEHTEVQIATVATPAPDISTLNAVVPDESAEAIARVLYGVKDYRLSDTAKRAVIEVIFNRVKCSYGEYGDSVLDVCNKAQQWQGYVADGAYLQSDYKLALDMLNSDSRAMIIPDDCYFLIVDEGKVTVRREWNSSSGWEVA